MHAMLARVGTDTLKSVANIPRLLKNAYLDFQVQRMFLGGTIDPVTSPRGDATATASANYADIETIFSSVVQIGSDDVIVDIGCGKGRVINHLLFNQASNRIIGIELNTEVAAGL